MRFSLLPHFFPLKQLSGNAVSLRELKQVCIYIYTLYICVFIDLHIYMYIILLRMLQPAGWFCPDLGRGELTMASQRLLGHEKEGTKFSSSPCLPLSLLSALSSQGRTSSMSSALAKEASCGFWTCTAWRQLPTERISSGLKNTSHCFLYLPLIWFLAGIWERWSAVGREDKNYSREVTCKEQVWSSCI